LKDTSAETDALEAVVTADALVEKVNAWVEFRLERG